VVNYRNAFLWTGLLGACAASLHATPQLSLSSTSLAQVTVAAGANGPTQSVDAQNIGTGSLDLQVTASAAWISATLGNSHTCTSGKGTCLPIQIALNTSSLAAGTYAGLVMVYDPNAIDTPQYINVSVQVGSGVPALLDFSVTPGTSASAGINTASTVGIKIVTANNGGWLSAIQSGGTPFSPSIPYTVTASAGAMAAGDYSGTLTISGSPVAAQNKGIPVTLHVVAPTVTIPLIDVGGALNNADYASGESLAQGDIIALFGTQLATGAPAGITALPLPTTLGESQVLLNGQAVPLYYVSANQINFEVPLDAQAGAGTLQVVSNGVNGNIISVTIAKAVPRIMQLYGVNGGYGIIVNASDNSLAIPATAGVASHPATVGQALVIYALGFGPTNPATTTGTASPTSPLADITDSPMVCFEAPDPFNPAGLCVKPLFAGLTPGYVGLYQINVVVPNGSPTGVLVPIYISTADGNTNVVNIAVQAAAK
jgi:uncharacterized protein (TIGR03437 family)